MITGITANGIYTQGASAGASPLHTSGSGWDVILRKYRSDGSTTWTRRFDVTDWDDVWGLAIDESGGIYIAGNVSGALPGQERAGNRDAYVRKYGPDGSVRWTRQFGTTRDDGASAVAVTRSGRVYVAGWTFGRFDGAKGSAGSSDVFVRKYRQR